MTVFQLDCDVETRVCGREIVVSVDVDNDDCVYHVSSTPLESVSTRTLIPEPWSCNSNNWVQSNHHLPQSLDHTIMASQQGWQVGCLAAYDSTSKSPIHYDEQKTALG